ncbi:SNF2 helicase associated domain-containing protein [Paenibacillus sp. GCM10012307]|uniref:SNF2 helicase associated domain-containing protein n=1 Tax=Paenibacillus roseus TaxID=2798579 RepID=A0A934IZ19_9BACL|nr:DEAD/DEAH box helicase [Paenibacillus roseus]MBJ6361847.1 SNF2 helicase associated domain-containing protein [Paenibacillus roseus]
MTFKVSDWNIKVLCGQTSFRRGSAYYDDGSVSFTFYDMESGRFEAEVTGNDIYEVQIDISRTSDGELDIDAECTCPAFYSYDHYCKHIAAVLLGIRELPVDEDSVPEGRIASAKFDSDNGRVANEGPWLSQTAPQRSALSSRDVQLANGFLSVFESKKSLPVHSLGLIPEMRAPLQIEFICKVHSAGYRKSVFAVEMKAGSKRLYIVQKIKAFLDAIAKQEPHYFSKYFTYDPKEHVISDGDEAIIHSLLHIYRNEQMMRDIFQPYSTYSNSAADERFLIIPSLEWDRILPLLAAASSVRMEHEGQSYGRLDISDEPIPVEFEFDQSRDENEGYHLKVTGVNAVTIMEPYRTVITGGKLVRMNEDSIKRLAEIKRLLGAYQNNEVRIQPDQMESFMEKAVPGLMKLGKVQIAPAISDRIVRTRLQPRLYLDRVGDWLVAGLEFQYGDIIINPLEGSVLSRGHRQILLRDSEKEQQIFTLMEQAGFIATESAYRMDDEEAEFEFLYSTIPQLEKLLVVHATSAVKTMLHPGAVMPMIKADVDERTDWLKFEFQLDGISEDEIRDVLKAVKEKRKFFRMKTGAFMPMDGAAFEEIRRMIEEMGGRLSDWKGAELRLPAWYAMRLQAGDTEGSAIKRGKLLRRFLDNLRNPDSLDFPLPDSLAPILRDYQKYGFQWMRTMAHYRFGGILADDMGLGKTLQSIAFLVSMLPEIRESGMPAFIVCPASLLYNWRNEIMRFAPELRVVIQDGSKSERSQAAKGFEDSDVIITSYPLLRRDIELYAKHSFHTLILDEAQAFKNYTTQTAQAVKALQARYRFALTGTPIENSIEELWSITSSVFPELFTSRKAFSDMSSEDISKRLKPFLLRRLKTEVLGELPEKIESLQTSELLPEQKKLYVSYLARLQQETVKHLDEDDFQKNRIKILAGITRLRQLCCHPGLFVEDYKEGSAKFEQLMELIAECRSAGKRMLIFSQFTEMLGLIARELGLQEIPFFYLDGKTPAAERVKLCGRFNEGQRDVFLISLKAGGTGLNLTGADTVILYDLWWNPAVEQQAADRAHRIGQKKVVQVIRLVAQGTVEEKMYELQQRKKNLVEQVVQPGQEALNSLTEQEIREILMLA